MEDARPVSPLHKVLAFVVHYAGVVTLILNCLAWIGLLIMPLGGKEMYHDENALLVGHSETLIRNGPALEYGTQLAMEVQHSSAGTPPGNISHGNAHDSDLQTTAMDSVAEMMGRLGMTTHWQTFTTPGRRQCRSLHGILRSPRGDGTEGLLLATPFALRASATGHPGFTQSRGGAASAAAVAAALAAHLSSVPWMSKDLVWLLPDALCGVQPSMQTWLDEYHGMRERGHEGGDNSGSDGLRSSGSRVHSGRERFGRAGQLQQAVVLLFGSAGAQVPSSQTTLKHSSHEQELWEQREASTLTAQLVGASGQLPKLDLYYLLQQYISIYSQGLIVDTMPPKARRLRRAVAKVLPPWLEGHLSQLWSLAAFGGQQAAGLPLSAAAAFKPFGIDAVTLQIPSLPQEVTEQPATDMMYHMAPVLELTWRSLDSLLERLHHSYFLYVPLSPDRFVTVEVYVLPALCMLLALALQAAWAAQAAFPAAPPTTVDLSDRGSAPAAEWREDARHSTPAIGTCSWISALKTVLVVHLGSAALGLVLWTGITRADAGSPLQFVWRSFPFDIERAGSLIGAVTIICSMSGAAWLFFGSPERKQPGEQTHVSNAHMNHPQHRQHLTDGDPTAVEASPLTNDSLSGMPLRMGEQYSKDDQPRGVGLDSSRRRSSLLSMVSEPSEGHAVKACSCMAAILQLAVMVCINWAAATAALLVVTPLLCLARPQPQPHPQPQPPLLSTRVPKPPKERLNRIRADRMFLALLLMLPVLTAGGILSATVLRGTSQSDPGLLTDLYGPTGCNDTVGNTCDSHATKKGFAAIASATLITSHQGLLLLFAAPVLPALIFGVVLPAWSLCTIIAMKTPTLRM